MTDTGLSEEQVVGLCQPDSPAGQRRRDIHKKACNAKDAVDVESMFAAYREAIEERGEYEEMWAKASLCVSKTPLPERPTEAIKEVALAAIQLARDVALGKRAEEDVR